MKLKHTLAPLTAALLAAGCNSGSQESHAPAPAPPSPTTTNQQSRGPEMNSPPSMSETTSATKDQFLAATEFRLKEMDAKIEALSAKSASVKDAAKAEAERALAELREKRDEVDDQLEALRSASTTAWADMKAGLQQAIIELEKAFNNAKSHLG